MTSRKDSPKRDPFRLDFIYRKYAPRCVYCGRHSWFYGVPGTCGQHRDLPNLDPTYGGGWLA